MRACLALLLLALPATTKARDYCPDRPGLNTPPCTIDKGRLSVETALADWTLERDPATRTDTMLIGDTLLRYGVTDSLEARLDWTPYGHVRQRDRLTGAVSRDSGVGDVVLSVRQNLARPAGDGLSIAFQPFVSVPVGSGGAGQGDWGAGLLAPISFELNDKLQLAATPEIDAAVDQDGSGRHPRYGSVVGAEYQLSKSVSATAELSLFRDHDPTGHSTQSLAGFSLAWQPSDDFQFDAGTALGLNRDSPDAEFYLGVARRF